MPDSRVGAEKIPGESREAHNDRKQGSAQNTKGRAKGTPQSTWKNSLVKADIGLQPRVQNKHARVIY